MGRILLLVFLGTNFFISHLLCFQETDEIKQVLEKQNSKLAIFIGITNKNLFSEWLYDNESPYSVIEVNRDEAKDLISILKKYNQVVDALFLGETDSENLLWSEIISFYPLLSKQCLVRLQEFGRNNSKLAIDYLLKNGWTFFGDSGQMILVREVKKNPFKIDLPDLSEPIDYVEIQRKLRSLDIAALLRKYYPQEEGYTTFNDFLSRCSRGILQTFVDEKNHQLPQICLEKIGKGSDHCIVTCAPFDGIRNKMVETISVALKESGFDGYFMYQVGGFPNPTGLEIQYAGVPYCFKIFMMLEAQKKGFQKVIWVDSSVLPLRDPTPLFDWLSATGAFIFGRGSSESYKGYIFPQTVDLLKKLTGTDVLNTNYICCQVFGLNMNTDHARSFIEKYYDCVKVGLPFLSCFPEEFVFTALMPDFLNSDWRLQPFENLINPISHDDTLERIEKMKGSGYFFYNRKH